MAKMGKIDEKFEDTDININIAKGAVEKQVEAVKDELVTES